MALAGERQQLVADAVPGQDRGAGAHLLRERQQVHDLLAPTGVGPQLPGALDVHHEPLRAQPGRHPSRLAHQRQPGVEVAHAHQQALAHVPGRADALEPAMGFELRIHPVGGPAERQLAQRDQVALPEEALERAFGLVWDVDLALAQALDQVVGREVHQLDLVGAIQDRIGHGLAHGDAGDLSHHVVEAVHVLDVQRGVHVDPGVEQLLDVLPALGVAGARRVGVGQLVEQQHLRAAGERGVEVELRERHAAILERAQRQDLEALEQARGLGASMGLDHADHRVIAGVQPLAGLEQHRIGLADSRGGAEEDLEAGARRALLLVRQALDQPVGVGAGFVHRSHRG